jgi:hypothetical protein
MAQIGNLTSGSNTVFNLDYTPERLLIGDAENLSSISSFSVVASGKQLMSVTSEERIKALAKFDGGAILGANSQVPNWIRLSIGRLTKSTTINIFETSGGPNPPAVYASSTGLGEVSRMAVEQSINPSANATFDNFEALFYDPINVSRIVLTFDNGFTDEYSPQEIDAMFAFYHATDSNGRLNGLSCIDAESGAGSIVQAVIYNGAGASTVVLKTYFEA